MSKVSTISSNNKMMTEFKKIFNCEYFTIENKRLFKDTIPFGWFEYENNLFIINYEYYAKDKSRSLKQVIKYYNIAKETEEFKKYINCYLIAGCGTKPLKCEIYSTTEDKITLTDKTLEDFKIIKHDDKKIFDPKIVHSFNQYLHDNNIKMTIHIKTFFATSILLCRKANPRIISFLDKKDNGIIIANYIVELIDKFYRDKLLTQQFKFIEYNLNNEHLYKLIKMLNFDIKNYNNDIINQFYSEFMIYDKKGNNQKTKKGIVLTPHDIVELMIKELNIKKGESVADFCTGTGSFLIEASNYTDDLIGCEKKEDLYTIAKSNFILHDLKTDKLFFNNCFNQKFEIYDHIILNPPFNIQCKDNKENNDIYGWRRFDTEQKFIIYQLQHLKENGTGCFIIPRSNFSNTDKKTKEFKKTLLNYCQILKIFNCNNNVFYPNASVECVICVFKKCKSKEKYETEIIDYTNDGYVISKKKRIKKSEPVIKSYKIILDYKDDWNFDKFLYLKNICLPDIKDIQFTLLNNEFQNKIKKYEITSDYLNISKEYQKFIDNVDNLENIKLKDWIKIKISDYFELVNVENTYEIKKSLDGIYPLISSTSKNNGVAKLINSYSVDIPECITVARNGSAGSCFYQSGKFAITGDVIILKLKEGKSLDLKLFSVLVTYFLTKKYNWSNKLINKKLTEEIIYYPIVEFTD